MVYQFNDLVTVQIPLNVNYLFSKFLSHCAFSQQQQQQQHRKMHYTSPYVNCFYLVRNYIFTLFGELINMMIFTYFVYI